MKRILLILICACVCLTACGCSKRESDEAPGAEPVSAPPAAPEAFTDDAPALNMRDIVRAPETYQGAWLSNTGKTTISVDASVFVPDVESFSIYEVAPRDIASEEVLLLAEAAFGAGNYRGDTEFVTDENDDTLHMDIDSLAYFKEDPMFSLHAYLGFTEYSMDSVVNFRRRQDHGMVYYSEPGSRPLTGGAAEGSIYTLGEAQAIADAVVRAFAPELAYAGAAKVKGNYYYDESDDDAVVKHTEAYAYILYYTKPYGGAPTTLIRTHPLAGRGEEPVHNYSTFNELIYVILSNDGIEEINYRTPHDTVSVLAENTTLLSFEQIINIAQSILPLKYASWERYGPYEKSVDRITLGYMRVLMRDSSNRYMMTPVWDFFNPEHTHESLLTINAIDGTIIDREYGY